MKALKSLLILASLVYSFNAIASDNNHSEGEKLFYANCAVCHGANVGQMDLSKRVAPPIAAVRMHYIGRYPDQASFVHAISNWVEQQDPAKSLMRGAIRRFNIMPPISISQQDTNLIAAYIYSGDIEKPVGFERHVNEEHKNRRGLGKGMYR